VAPVNGASPDKDVTFRWTYIVLPAGIFLFSLVILGVFYPRLPEEIAFHFRGSSPDRWLSRGAVTAWMVIPQVFCTLLAFAVVRTVLLGARYWPAGDTPLKKLLPVMGNMVALPQVIIIFTMLDVFLYNAYQIRLIPVWVFAVIVMVLGGLFLAVFFFRTIRRFRRQGRSSLQE